MKILYSPDTSSPSITQRSVTSTSPVFTATGAATGVALIGCSYANATVEASDDGFATTLYSASLGVVAGNVLVEGINVAVADWRVSGAGTFGAIVPGTLVTITSPTYPWAWEESIASTDRRTLGGAVYSRIHRTQRVAQWVFEVPNVDDPLPTWRAWYSDTNGFRKPFVAVDPLENSAHLVVAPGPFPLTREGYAMHRGSMNVSEVPVG